MQINVLDHNQKTIGTIEPFVGMKTKAGTITEVSDKFFLIKCEFGTTTQISAKSLNTPDAYFIDLDDSAADNVVSDKPIADSTKAVRLMRNSSTAEFRSVIKALANLATSNTNTRHAHPPAVYSGMFRTSDSAELAVISQLLKNK